MRIIDNIRMRIDNIRSWWIERRLMKGLRNNWRLALKRHVKVTKLLNQHDKLDPGNGPIKVVLAWCDRRRKLYAMKEESNEKFNRCNNAIAELEMAIAARKIGQSIQDLTKEKSIWYNTHMNEKDKFKAYLRVQAGGLTNMWDVRAISDLTGKQVTKNECADIQDRYDELCDKYPELVTEFLGV